MRIRVSRAAVAAFGAVAVSSVASADPCAVDLKARTMRCLGRAGPNPTVTTLAAARVGAEKAARANAERNALEALRGVRMDAGQTVGDVLQGAPDIEQKVRGAISRFKVVDTRYYGDGGVDIDVELPLDDLLNAAAAKAGAEKK